MAQIIKQNDVQEYMDRVPEWQLEGKQIERTFEFADFTEAVDFVNAVAEVAEEDNHHPDINIRYNKVQLVLTTHSKKALTEADIELAEKIDQLMP